MLAPEIAAVTEADTVFPLTLRLFGPFEVRLHGQLLPRLRTRKGQWLLALLILRHGREVERSWLAGTLWPDSSEAAAYASLRNSLKDMRHALGTEAGRLCSPTPRTLSLDLEGTDVDVLAFDEAIAQGEEPALERAVALYRGPLLEGCVEEWALPDRQAREQACLAALETLATRALERSAPTPAERYLRRAVTLEPLRESAQRALMQALAAGGNWAAATQVYRELRLRLHRELNAAPDPETQILYQQLRTKARGQPASATEQRSLPSSPVSPALRPPVPPSRPPEGTVTFLFTDIEGSSQLWERHPQAMRDALEHHDALLSQAIQTHGGLVFKTVGDAFYAAFATAPAAVAAALGAQQALLTEDWGDTGPLRVRMALHTGIAETREGDYFGPSLNRVARLLDAGHGGQVLLSLPTEELVRDELPEGTSLRPLGEHRLKDLVRSEQVFQLLHTDLPASFPPLRSLAAFTHNLPLQWSSFIGREKEMEEVKRLLPTTPLLTLSGAGGCGKTRLALQAAADLLEAYPDGVWLVELAALEEPILVPQAVATALGVPEQPGRPLTATLIEHLRSRSLLLLLDNCEHLLAACAQLVEALLGACAKVRILATSRERLGLTGERVYPVPSLSLPELPPSPPSGTARVAAALQSEAVQLFVERAVCSRPQFALTEQNADAVAQLCQRLDGIPLALELAAARVKTLPVEQINARIGDSDRFRLLTGGSRTALPRQQTLLALIDWSYDLLSEPEQTLLRHLSVFSGGWSLEAAEAVCGNQGAGCWVLGAGCRTTERDTRQSEPVPPLPAPSTQYPAPDVLDLLTALVEKSLVVYEEPAGEARYWLLETVRQYARDRLLAGEEAMAVRHRHAEYFLQLAEWIEPQFRGPEQLVWSDRLEGEHDNLRAALTWFGSVEDGAEAQLRLTGALWFFWFSRGHFREGRQWLEAALARRRHATERFRSKALVGAGHLAFVTGNYAAAGPLLEESVAVARATGQKWDAALSLSHWARLAITRGEYERATGLAQESLALAREVGDPWLCNLPLVSLGLAALYQGDSASARSFFEECLAVARSMGDRFHIARSTAFLGAVALQQGEWKQAGVLYREALTRFQEAADKRAIAGSLSGLAVLSAAQKQPQRAARLFGAAEVLREGVGSHRSLTDYPGYEHTVTAIRAHLGEPSFAATWAEGRAMSLKEACAYALEESPDA
jgi:predicted ATPase/class 3 adenylate cyclase